ncbi:hypothetical protein ABVT39_018057 [Epinephelus coioides]
MKTVILALVVLLVVSQGEALKCLCGGRTRCPGRHQTCTGPNQVCAYFAYHFEISEQTRENMKTVILALVVLLVVSQGEALTCYCGGRKQCSESTETCTGSNEVCAIIVSQHEISEQTRENMKTVILALVVLLVVSQGEALRCYCGGRTDCSDRIQTCSGSNQVCAYIIFHHDYSYFQSCYNEDDCRLLSQSPVTSGSCCSTDLCN